MKELRRFMRRAAATDAPVLIEGESGTGKSHMARRLHARGDRGAAPFVAVNCAGVPDGLFESEFFGHRRGAFTGAHMARPGLFEQAHGGTLLLDEVGELPLRQQAKLLSVLEEGVVRPLGGVRVRSIDVRIVAATCRTLADDVRTGRFRIDLYHRMSLLRWTLPPLRQRMEDLEALVTYLLATLGGRHDVDRPEATKGAIELLKGHRWPGNIRELSHVLEAGLILSGRRVLGAKDLRPVLDQCAGEPFDRGAA